MRGDTEAAFIDGGHVVDEAPLAGGAAGAAGQGAPHGELADLAGAALADLKHGWFNGGG